MKQYTNCPICAEASFNKVMTCTDFTVSKEEFSIDSCSNCGFHFTNPIPAEDKLGGYYESEDYISHSNSNKGLINKLYQAVREKTIKRKRKLIETYSSNKNLLDIGSGTGEFLNHCQENGFEVKGIEPALSARSYAIENFSLAIAEESALNEFPDASFDNISMWHVLEHVYHLNDRVAQINRLLSASGHAFIAVPNRKSYDAQVYGKYWAAYDLPRHLYHFTKEDIELLFQKHNLKLVDVLPMKFDSYYVSLLSEKYKNGKANLLYAFYNGFLSNLKAKGKHDMGFSSQIYVFRKN